MHLQAGCQPPENAQEEEECETCFASGSAEFSPKSVHLMETHRIHISFKAHFPVIRITFGWKHS
ncbi:hypothetical protein P3383_23580 [Vibrio parahaemolyticus]|nr:hypothetical protein [Vibrio parahaemolyticus]